LQTAASATPHHKRVTQEILHTSVTKSSMNHGIETACRNRDRKRKEPFVRYVTRTFGELCERLRGIKSSPISWALMGESCIKELLPINIVANESFRALCMH